MNSGGRWSCAWLVGRNRWPLKTCPAASVQDTASAVINFAVSALRLRFGSASTVRSPLSRSMRPRRGAMAADAVTHTAWRLPTAQVEPSPYLSAPSSPSDAVTRSEEHTSELQSLMRISYAVFCLKQQQLYMQ